MTSLVALSISIGVLGGVATWLALGPLGGFIVVWGMFVGWATFFALGGDNAALQKGILCNLFGVFCAWVAAVLILSIPLAEQLSLPVWAAIMVGLTVLGLCLGAHIGLLSSIPASVFGYASTFAFYLQTPDVMTLDLLTGGHFGNVTLQIALSLVAGGIFGWISGKLGGVLTQK
ncbi:MAG: DUF1097 domain-containing protein [Gammaproteobacteria bacterium]|nr:DUF1097 domain-containing protein [Gammaproteobacteria bacterium]MCI0590259.1 DUF1097 domain-containing protein [Gammaproteobacteria bacterium]